MIGSRHPFRINVGFIIHEHVGYAHEFTFEFESTKFGTDLQLRDFAGTLNIGRTAQGLLLTGTFAARTELECVRCLKPYEQGLNWNLSELYAFNEKSVTDSGLVVPEDAQVDLQPLIREYALLEVPIKPICKADCRGLCPVCGQDLNIWDCGHRPELKASAFAALKDFLRK